MPLRIFLIGLLITLVSFDVANATRDDEIREQKAVFILKDFRQSTSLSYLFSGHTDNGTRSSTSHAFQENYNAGFNADVLDRHIFSTSLSFSLGLNQNLDYRRDQSSSGRNLRYSYQFNGTGFDKSATPFTLNSYRNTATVLPPYSPSYTTSSTGSELRADLRNDFLPSKVRFSRRTLENSGSGFDSSTVNNSYSFDVSHQYRGFSASGLAISLSESTGSFAGGPKTNSTARSASLFNTLSWGEQNKYTLSSQAQLFDTLSQNVPQRNSTLSESFYDRLGKALDLQVNYFLSNSSGMGYENQLTETNLHSLDATLSHRLFDSLTSRVKAKASYQELLGGSESRYSSQGDLAYTKRIPGDNRLTIGASGAHEVVDSRLAASDLSKEEVYFGVHKGDLIVLPLSGGILKRVSVKSSSTFSPYVEGDDYTVDWGHGEIFIVIDSTIDMGGGGEDLLISYTVSLDPVVKYANNSFSMNAGITFMAGKYSLGGSYSEQWMTLMEGPAENNLRDSSSKRLYFSGNLNPLTYRVNYTESQVGNLQSQLFEATGQYSRNSHFGRFSLAATERYSRYGATSTVDASAENTVSGSLSYLRNIFSNARLTMSAHALDRRSERRGTRDVVSLRGSLHYTLNKMSLSFDGRSEWNFSSGTTTRDDTVSFDLLRYL